MPAQCRQAALLFMLAFGQICAANPTPASGRFTAMSMFNTLMAAAGVLSLSTVNQCITFSNAFDCGASDDLTTVVIISEQIQFIDLPEKMLAVTITLFVVAISVKIVDLHGVGPEVVVSLSLLVVGLLPAAIAFWRGFHKSPTIVRILTNYPQYRRIIDGHASSHVTKIRPPLPNDHNLYSADSATKAGLQDANASMGLR